MNSRGPCRPDNLALIFPQDLSKVSNSSTFSSRQAGNIVQAICNMDLHPLALGEAKPLVATSNMEGSISTASMQDFGKWSWTNGEAAPTQAYHQHCQGGLCNKRIQYHLTICLLTVLYHPWGGERRKLDYWLCPGDTQFRGLASLSHPRNVEANLTSENSPLVTQSFLY